MKAIDKQSGCVVNVLSVDGNPTVDVMIDGVINYRKLSDLEFREPSFNLNDTVRVTLTHEGAFHLNKKGVKKSNGSRWNSGDEYVTVLWKLMPMFSKYFHSGGDAPFKKMRGL